MEVDHSRLGLLKLNDMSSANALSIEWEGRTLHLIFGYSSILLSAQASQESHTTRSRFYLANLFISLDIMFLDVAEYKYQLIAYVKCVEPIGSASDHQIQSNFNEWGRRNLPFPMCVYCLALQFPVTMP